MNNKVLPILIFISGAAIMVLEIVGTRMLAPYFGSTTHILTSIISVVLGALSIGYWLGGSVADKNPTYKKLSYVIYISSILLIITFSFREEVLRYILSIKLSKNIAIFFASMFFFGPVNILLGMVSPYALRLQMKDIKNIGALSGTFSAIATVGSIVGTVCTGLFFIPNIGIDIIVYLTGIVLFLCALLVSKASIYNKITFIFTILLLLSSLVFFRKALINKSHSIIEYDSEYQHISVEDKKFSQGNKSVMGRFLSVNNHCCQSAMSLEDPTQLILAYTKYFTLSHYYVPQAKKILILGGGGNATTKFFLKQYPDIAVDVVEIDPVMTKVAMKHFKLKSDPRLHIFTEDARVFLNTNKKKYDVIIVDVFSDYSIPFFLTTKEAILNIKNSLSTNGIVITNIISAIEGSGSLFYLSEYATYNSLFSNVMAFQVGDRDKEIVQNIILIGFKGDVVTNTRPPDAVFKQLVERRINTNDIQKGLILTDNYAPVENFFIFPEQ